MAEIEIIAKKWGNSIGIVLPREIVEAEKIRENEKLRIIVIKEDRVIDRTFGLLRKDIDESGQEIKNKLRKELYD